MTELISVQSALIMVTGVVLGMVWSFLMASKVAAPRAKRLLIEALQGKTEADREAIDKVRGNLIRPELVESTAAITKQIAAFDDRFSLKIQGVSDNLDAKLQGIVIPDAPDLDELRGAIMDDVRLELSNLKESIPEVPVAEITESIKTHLEMAIKGQKATEANQIRRFLKESGALLEGAAGETEDILISQLSDEQLVMRKLLGYKVPDSIQEDMPLWADLVKGAQGLGAQMMQRRIQQGAQGYGGGAVTIEPSGAGYSPYGRQ